MEKGGYLNIQEWMLDLGFKDLTELMLFALVFGFSQDGSSEYQGSLSHICKWLMCSKSTTQRTIKNLEKRGLLRKKPININGVTLNRYSVILPKNSICIPPSQIDHPLVKLTPNNNIDNILSPTNVVDNPPLNNIPSKSLKKDNARACEEPDLFGGCVEVRPKENTDSVVEFWNKEVGEVFGKVKVFTAERKKKVATLVKKFGKEEVLNAMKKAAESKFLIGENDRGWRLSFDDFLKEKIFCKIIEGSYDTYRCGTQEQTEGVRARDYDDWTFD